MVEFLALLDRFRKSQVGALEEQVGEGRTYPQSGYELGEIHEKEG
jgi:hypothetical protein